MAVIADEPKTSQDQTTNPRLDQQGIQRSDQGQFEVFLLEVDPDRTGCPHLGEAFEGLFQSPAPTDDTDVGVMINV
jgi:hypothetical protein